MNYVKQFAEVKTFFKLYFENFFRETKKSYILVLCKFIEVGNLLANS